MITNQSADIISIGLHDILAQPYEFGLNLFDQKLLGKKIVSKRRDVIDLYGLQTETVCGIFFTAFN